MTLQKHFICFALFSALLIPAHISALEERSTLHDTLPTIGNTSSSLVSIEQEKALGKAWLRSLRQQTRIYGNTIVENYFRNLVYTLAPNSQVIDREFRFVIVDSPSLNAFAVPGSIIGINAGLFFNTGNEQEFASVIAHELAHLSQRHYARQLEQQQISTPLTLAGILASVVLAATTGSDLGLAALASTQALSVDQQLRFSRKNEQEADRLGIEILYQSNYDPRAMPSMFERMYRKTRVDGNAIPEYLSTHPLSDTRISDSRNRANQFPVKKYKDSLDYHLCRTIVISDYSESPQKAKLYFQSILAKGNSQNIDAIRFGLAYSQVDTAPKESIKLLETLLERYPSKITFNIVYAFALQADKQSTQAIKHLEQLLIRNPNNYPITEALAQLYLKSDLISKYEKTLVSLSRQYDENPKIWYQLAEAHGLAGHIVELHMARAEYYFLTNRIDTAIDQLNLALKKNKIEAITAKIQKRMDDFFNIKQNPIF